MCMGEQGNNGEVIRGVIERVSRQIDGDRLVRGNRVCTRETRATTKGGLSVSIRVHIYIKYI